MGAGGDVMTDEKTGEVLMSMLGYVRLWAGDVCEGILPTKGSLATAHQELLEALAEPDEYMGSSDQTEYLEAHLGRVWADAEAMKKEMECLKKQ